jgi:hypothetical protein
MTQDYRHHISPPLELMQQWILKYYGRDVGKVSLKDIYMAKCAAQWGSDQELEACCDVLDNLNDGFWSEKLRAARRPKPPSLKEQALEALDEEQAELSIQNYKLIRAVLESLPDNE